jgi:integrase
MFAFLTGWRLEEIRGLDWRHVDFKAGEIRLDPGTTKNGDARVFPMTEELRALLIRVDGATRVTRKNAEVASNRTVLHMIAKQTEPVFQISGERLGAFRKSWKTACYRAGIPCVVQPVKSGGKIGAVKIVQCSRIFHDLRRSAAREMENQGVPRSVIMELMGHNTESMFIRYRVVSDSDKRRAADIIDGARNGAKGSADTAENQ